MPRWTDGVVLFDKPLGISSQKAVTIVKHACLANKAGHTGTLDPLATGLLAICLGEATKYSQDLFNADKTYITKIHFGITTETGDAEGKIIAQRQYEGNTDNKVFLETLENICPSFTGAIQQVPPMYSAIKKDGRPLYAYAREGEMFDLAAREVHIRYLKWLNVDFPNAELEVSCSKGTYIRSLVSDMGELLGCGAHLTALRRTKIGHLQIEDAQIEEEVKVSANLMAVDSLITHLPAIILNQEVAMRFKMGQRVAVKDIELPNTPESIQGVLVATSTFKIYHLKNMPEMFMGLVELKNGVLHPKRLMATDRLEYLLGLGGSDPFLGTDISIRHHLTKPIH
jgi:tRNA pseudouridine55 synthase